MGDELRLSQILINIAGNALKFTHENGKITVRIQEVYSDNKAARISSVSKIMVLESVERIRKRYL